MDKIIDLLISTKDVDERDRICVSNILTIKISKMLEKIGSPCIFNTPPDQIKDIVRPYVIKELDLSLFHPKHEKILSMIVKMIIDDHGSCYYCEFRDPEEKFTILLKNILAKLSPLV